MTTLHQRLVAHILADGSPKEFAIDNGIHKSTAQKILSTLGIRKMFVTEEERKAILEMRKLLKP